VPDCTTLYGLTRMPGAMSHGAMARASFLLLTLVACQPAPGPAERIEQQQPAPAPASAGVGNAAENPPFVLVNAARGRIPLHETYDPAYFSIAYPNGDVPNDRGVCSDVVIRAYRQLGIDLQVLVHEDMARNFSAYPRIWGLRSTDKNIDHRRVPNLQRFLERQDAELPITTDGKDYLPGDLVTWMLPGNLPHIGIISDTWADGSDRPLVLHNIGAGTAEDDILFTYRITGHYRFYPEGT